MSLFNSWRTALATGLLATQGIAAIALTPTISNAAGVIFATALQDAEVSSLTPSATTALENIKHEKGTKSVAVIRVDKTALMGPFIDLSLDFGTVRFTKISLDMISATQYTWSGKGTKGETALFSIDGNIVFGNIQASGENYELRTIPGGVQTLVHLDMSDANRSTDKVLPAKSSSAVYKPSLESTTQRLASAKLVPQTVANVPVRILVAYSQRAASALGSQLTAQINQAIAQINAANTASAVNFTAVLAGTLPVTFNGPYDADSTLKAFEVMPAVLAAHDSSKADLMIMLEVLNANTDAGQAYGVNVTASNAFAVVSTEYMTSNLSFAHEIGHLMGADHTIGDPQYPGDFRAGHGFWWFASNLANPDWNSTVGYCSHSVMSYAVQQTLSPAAYQSGTNIHISCITDPRLQVWSNETYTVYIGPYSYASPAGSPTADNASVLNITAPLVTNFHNTVLSPNNHVPSPAPPNCKTNPRACAITTPPSA